MNTPTIYCQRSGVLFQVEVGDRRLAGLYVTLADYDELNARYRELLVNFTIAQTENNRIHQRDCGNATP